MKTLSQVLHVELADRKTAHTSRVSSVHSGLGQLTLVEHALSPLASLAGNTAFVHESRFRYVGSDGRSLVGEARITAAHGLKPSDELLLWGLLAVAVRSSSAEIHATPHSLLRRLHGISSQTAHGGRDYQAFRQSLRRLSGVTYACNGFYDPIRREHRDVAFGILSYDLPFKNQPDRAWRIAFDRLFFEYCGVAGGRLFFRWQIYRDLDVASRRLYLFLAKIFCRREWTHWLDVRELAVEVLGFAPTLDIRNLKQKLIRVVRRLMEVEVLDAHTPLIVKTLFKKRSKGCYSVRLKRGPLAVHRSPRPAEGDANNFARVGESTHARLIQLGMTAREIERLSLRYAAEQIELWTEITSVARDRFGDAFFRKGPIPYLRDNLKAASAQIRVPPDWWRKAVSTNDSKVVTHVPPPETGTSKRDADAQFVQYLRDEVSEEFNQHVEQLTSELIQSGKTPVYARQLAVQHAIDHWRRRFDSRPPS